MNTAGFRRGRVPGPNWSFTQWHTSSCLHAMWRRTLVAFLSSVLGAAVGLGLLFAAFIYLYGGDAGEGTKVNIVISLHILVALALAAAIWGSIVGGVKLALRAGFICLQALVLSGPIGFGIVLLAIQFWPKPDVVVLWPITTLAATIAAAIGAAFMGWRLGGTRLLWRATLVGALPTGLIFAFPLTTALLMYSQSATLVLLFIPFVILATYLGAAIHPPAQSESPVVQQVAPTL
jgi:hypothetical protein